MEFDGKVALVTGAASGIGRAVAEAFAAAGATVAVADIDAAGAQQVAAALDGLAVAMDVTEPAVVASAVGEVLTAYDHIDVLVNVAGWDRIMPFLDSTPEHWQRVLSINFLGVLATCHAVVPAMVERGSGVVVNTASEAGRSGSSGEAVYSGAKGGVIAFSKALAREVARYGIRVNVVAPGLTDTPLLDSMIADGHGKLIEAIVKATPLRRLATPAEVADAVLFMASERASFVTGQTLGVGGGLVMP